MKATAEKKKDNIVSGKIVSWKRSMGHLSLPSRRFKDKRRMARTTNKVALKQGS